MTRAVLAFAAVLLAGFAAVAMITGWYFRYPLSWGGFEVSGTVLYWPGAHLTWWDSVPSAGKGALIVAYIASTGVLIAALRLAWHFALTQGRQSPTHGADHWASRDDIRRGGLLG